MKQHCVVDCLIYSVQCIQTTNTYAYNYIMPATFAGVVVE